ncbi:MAG: aromatic ring-hydroxylating dioxygenase subunit alpha [Gammaproteobacteria bacterium]|nr:aromatic ring-hydroxylating dioxygenase subunit alpha [Gammaproteobacteria bacterium]
MSTSIESKRREKIGAIATASMANRAMPLIRNAWYVAAQGSELGRTPIARQLLERSVVLFRRENGEAVALQNRCCHRSFPLSEGRLEGDTLVCRYHGFRYNCEGRVIEVPSQSHPPGEIGVHCYPVREKSPFVWFWAGDPGKADEACLPHQEWLESADWDRYAGYLHINASYVHMHENLLDLSHLSFLHEKTFGTPEYARAPIEMTVEPPNFEVWRHVECELPAIYSKPLGWTGQKAIRSSGAQFVGPGLHVNTGVFRNLEIPESGQEPKPMVKVAQLITPESRDATHYWYCLSRNFARHDEGVTEFMKNAQYAAFSEDVYALEHIRGMQDLGEPPGFLEINVAADRPGVEMRRYLKQLSDAEQAG